MYRRFICQNNVSGTAGLMLMVAKGINDDEINEEMVSKNVCIKPKLLEGYRVIPCRKIKDHKDKKSAVKREDICPYCGKKTRSMKSHILVHAGAKTFLCDVCDMSFFNKYSLKTHSRVHTGERPFKCELCSQPYSYKRDFNDTVIKNTA
ncbi:zinc finger protein [Danaus plexippus plexippus]|uniref:Zinc finger protein n=1 Tax=Danaus plexippus plexippus TaxID=278856 RepID=A0A212EV97_DANPL|nr:zinc finger protein [Danaus plexippus plexippus]